MNNALVAIPGAWSQFQKPFKHRLPEGAMSCVDCHNPRGRPGMMQTFAASEPGHAGREEAATKIPASLQGFYREKYADINARRSSDIACAASTIVVIYNRNVFPDLKVTWGTYPNNLGHTDFPGCFRCHDEAHATSDKKTIAQDCGVCHNALAVDEVLPDILKTLGMVKP